MKINFEQRYLEDIGLSDGKLTGYFPNFIFYCDQKLKVISLHSAGNGSVREIKICDEEYHERYRVSLSFFKEKADKAWNNGARIIVAGFYNTIEKKFVEVLREEITDKNNEVELNQIKNIVNTFYPIAHNESYYNKDLLDLNIESSDDRSLFSMSGYGDSLDLRHISLLEIYKDLEPELKNHQGKYLYLDENLPKEKLDSLRINEIKTLDKDLVRKLSKKYKIEEVSFISVANTLRVYGVLDLIIYNKEGKVNSYTNIVSFDVEHIMNNPSEYFIGITYNKRLVESSKRSEASKGKAKNN